MYTQVLGEADSLLVQVVDSVFRKRCNMGCNMEIWLCGNPNPNKGVYEFNLFIFLLLLFLPDVDSPYASKTVLQVIRSAWESGLFAKLPRTENSYVM